MPEETFVSIADIFETLRDIEGLPLDQIIPTVGEDSLLQDLGFTELASSETDASITEHITLAVRHEVVFDLPGLAGFQLVIGRGNGFFELPLEIEIDRSGAAMTFRELRITGMLALRFPRTVLKPMRQEAGAWVEIPDEFREFVTSSTVVISASGEVSFGGAVTFDLEPAMIGDTGVIVSAEDVQIVFSDAALPAGAPPGFRGVYIGAASLFMQDQGFPVTGLSLQNALISSGGFSGDVDLDLSLSGSLAGFDFTLTHFGLTFQQNSITGSDIRGRIMVPFFEGPLDVTLALSSDGSFAVALSSATGIAALDVAGLLTMQLDSVEFASRANVAEISLGGSLELTFSEDLELPTFAIQKLTISSEGDVLIEGGWIDLGDALSFDFYGFQIELTRIGFGSEGEGAAKRNWIGLSGGIKLVDGLAIGGSVDGLKISWSASASGPSDLDVQLALDGIGVELTIPEILDFRGEVHFLNDPATDTQGFAGDISLTLPSLSFSGEASILVGKRGGLTFFYLAVSADLPLGIPLAQTGVAFYGFQGLIGFSVYPNKTPEQSWYEDWYLTPTPGVTSAMKWYPPVPDAFAIGLGATLGTFPDNGFAVSGKVLIALVLPGPLLLIDGRANFLAPRGDLNATDPSKPPFRALLVIDGREGTFLLNIGAVYEKEPLVRIAALAEAFFNFNDPGAWHLYLGVDEPRDKRVQATIFDFLEVQAYWMLTARDLRFGAWAGYENDWSFGPLRVVLEAWIEGGVLVGFDPLQIAGFLELHGHVALRAFGIGLGLSVDARLEAEAPKPFRVKGEFDVEIDLPWPLPDVGASVTLEWKGSEDPPDFPVVIKSIDLEHALTDGTWRGLEGPVSRSLPASQPVPVDCRPVISFGRPVRDNVGFVSVSGIMAYSPETSGNYTFEHGLMAVRIEDVTNPASPVPVTPVSGAWKATVDPSGALASKLEVWGKNPFDYHGSSGTGYADWVVDNFPDVLCGDDGRGKPECQDFDGVQPGERYTAPFTLRKLTFVPGPRDFVFGGAIGTGGATRPVLELRSVRDFHVRFENTVESVEVHLLLGAPCTVIALQSGTSVGQQDAAGSQAIAFPGLAVDELVFIGAEARLVQICWQPLSNRETQEYLSLLRQVTAQSVIDWYSEAEILKPGRDYRVTVETRSTRSGPAGTDTSDQTAQLTFRTAAPPALSPRVYWLPPATGDPAAANPFDTLTPFIAGTVPFAGQRPFYRTYDISVLFKVNYVETMYTGDLRIRLFGPSDREATTPSGLPSAWGRGRTVTLTESEQLWLATLREMRCEGVELDLDLILTNTTISTSDPALLLEPELRYEAKLFAAGVEAYRFSFVTSRYRNFAEHMATFDGRVWTDPVAVPDVARLSSLVAAARAGGPALDPAEAAIFEELYYGVLGLPQRDPPRAVEWSQVRSPSGVVALLLSSPEPLDWARMTMDVRRRTLVLTGPGIPGRPRAAYVPVETVWVRHADGTRALVFFPSGTTAAGPVPVGRLRFTYSFQRDAGPSLPLLSVAGDTSPESATHTLVLPT